MTLKRSFLDSWNTDTLPSWLETQVPAMQSSTNSQNETLLDAQSQTTGNLDYSQFSQTPQAAGPTTAVRSDEARQHRNEFKIVKRIIEKTFQDTSSSISSLHEKTSKINLGVSDLHSDLKKLERTVMFENDASHSKGVDMEIKLNNVAEKLESKISSRVVDNVTTAINRMRTDIENVVREKDGKAPLESSALKEWQDGVNQALETLTSTVYRVEGGLRLLYMQTAIQNHNAQIQNYQTVLAPFNHAQPCNTHDNQALVSDHPPLAIVHRNTYQQDPPHTEPFQCANTTTETPYADSLCITTLHNIMDNRTSCPDIFNMTWAMDHVDDKYPAVLDRDGWPILAADAKNKRCKTKGC